MDGLPENIASSPTLLMGSENIKKLSWFIYDLCLSAQLDFCRI